MLMYGKILKQTCKMPESCNKSKFSNALYFNQDEEGNMKYQKCWDIYLYIKQYLGGNV